MPYDFDEIISRKSTNSVKWEFIPAGDDTVEDKLLPLWIADMDFACASPIIEDMKKRVDHRIFGYSSPYTDNYLSAVVNWFDKRSDWKINKDDIVVAPGVVPALGILIRALTSARDGIIIQKPVYYPFTNLILNNDRKVINNPLIQDGNAYKIDFEDLEKKAKDASTKMLILCNPHNPVGRVWNENELIRLAEICLKNDVLIISDDIHCDLIRETSRYIPLSKLNPDKHIITCTSASKSFNLAGMQVSNIVIKDKAMRKEWEKEAMGKCGLFGSNALGIVATQSAYSKGEEWLNQANRYIDRNLEFVGEFVSKHFPKARYSIPEGTYFAWIDFRDYGHSIEDLEKMMIYKAHVALDEGYIFGHEGDGFERINVACPRPILKQCLEQIASVLN